MKVELKKSFTPRDHGATMRVNQRLPVNALSSEQCDRVSGMAPALSVKLDYAQWLDPALPQTSMTPKNDA
jgi:hypothetical protein